MEPGGKEELGVGGSIFPNKKDSNSMLRGALGGHATFTSAGGGRGLRCGPQHVIVSRLFGSDLITFTFLYVVFTFYVVCCVSKFSSVLEKDSCELKVLA